MHLERVGVGAMAVLLAVALCSRAQDLPLQGG